MDSERPTAVPPLAGLALATPGLLFVAANVLKHYTGAPFLYDSMAPLIDNGGRLLDAVVVGGPVLAFLVSVIPVLRLEFRREQGTLVGTVALRMSWFHLAVAGLSLATIGTLGLYLASENLPCILGQRAYC